MTTKDWKQKSSTGWSLHELTQERKNFDPGSAEYQKIQDAINLGYKTGGPVKPIENIDPKNVAKAGWDAETKKKWKEYKKEKLLFKTDPEKWALEHGYSDKKIAKHQILKIGRGGRMNLLKILMMMRQVGLSSIAGWREYKN